MVHGRTGFHEACCVRRADRKPPSACRHLPWMCVQIRRCRAPRSQSPTCTATIRRAGSPPWTRSLTSSRRPSERGTSGRRRLPSGQRALPVLCRAFSRAARRRICCTGTCNSCAFFSGQNRHSRQRLSGSARQSPS